MNAVPRLPAVVEVDMDDATLGQAEGYGHSVYKRSHVVRGKHRITVIGSACCNRRCGGLAHLHQTPLYGSSEGRRLSREECAALRQNTARPVTAMEAEHLDVVSAKEAQLRQAKREEADKAAASRGVPTTGRFGAFGNSRYRGVRPVSDMLAGVPESD